MLDRNAQKCESHGPPRGPRQPEAARPRGCASRRAPHSAEHGIAATRGRAPRRSKRVRRLITGFRGQVTGLAWVAKIAPCVRSLPERVRGRVQVALGASHSKRVGDVQVEIKR